MEEQTDAPKQAPSGEKIFDELPTFVAPVTTALGGAVGEQATRYDLNDNFSIFKVGDQQKPPEEAAQKNLDFSNPDAFVIGQPPTQNYVHLDFDLDPLASTATVSTPPQASTAITKANLLDDDLDDWSTEAHKQPIISATEQSSFTEPPKPLEQVGVNVTNIMETSCIDNLLADLPEETDEEEDEASNRSSNNNNNNQNDSDWYLKETHVKEKESSSFLHEESIVTTSNVVFEPSEPEAVSLPPSSGSPDRPQQQQFTYGDTSLESSLRTSTEVKEMSFEESSSLWSTSSVTQTTTTAITGEPQEPQQQQPNSPVTSESGAPKSTRSRPSQPPPPPPPATMSSSSSSDLDDGHRGGGAQKSPEQSEQNKPAELWTFDSPAAGSGGQAAETTIASASSSSSFFSSAAPVVTETVAAAVLPPLPSSPPSWSTSAAPVAPVATTADNTTTTARQASVDDDVSNSSSSSYPQEEQQPTSAEAIFSSLGSSFVPPSPPSVQLQSSTSAVPPPPPVPSVKEEEEVVVETKKTESETLSWSPPSPVKEVPPKKEEVVVKQSPAFEAPKQQQLKSSSSSTTMGRKNRRDNSSDDGADHAAGSDQIREYIENVLGPNVAELVYWRDLKHSGAAFGLGLVLLFSLTFFSVISVVAYTLFFTLLASLSFRIYKNVMQAVQKTGEGHPFKEYLEIQITPSQERIHEIVESAIIHGTTFINRLRSVLLVEDIVDSLKYLVIFWAFTYIGAWFNGLTVIILLYLGAFSLPLLYEQNRPLIDQYLELANSKITEISDKVPFLKKAVAAAPAEKKDE